VCNLKPIPDLDMERMLRRDAVVPKAFPADGIAEDYAGALFKRLDRGRKLVESRLLKVVEREMPRTDSLRSDDLETVKKVIQGIEVAYFRENGAPEQMALEFGRQTSNHQRDQLVGQVKEVIGIDPALAEPYLERELDRWVAGNVARITSIEEMYFAELEARVEQAFREGWSTEKIAQQIQKRYGVSESRAAFIARDQVATLTGQLNKRRQQELGVDSYVWRTSEDERVRDSHRNNNGKSFKWDEPPAGTGHPGDDYQCRCNADPDFSALTDDIIRAPRKGRQTEDSAWKRAIIETRMKRVNQGYI